MRDGREDRSYDLDTICRESTVELETAKRQAESLGMHLIQIENTGYVTTVCRNIVRNTMGNFEFHQELLKELSNGFASKERLH